MTGSSIDFPIIKLKTPDTKYKGAISIKTVLMW